MGIAGASNSRVSLCKILGASIRSAEAPSASLNARVDGNRCAGFFDKAFNSAFSTRGSRPGTRGVNLSGRWLICACIKSYSLVALNGGEPDSIS